MNLFAKSLLVLTSLSPAFFVMGVNQFECCNWLFGTICMGLTLVLIGVCLGLLKYIEKNGPESPLYIKEFENRDQQILPYLFIYLLPFIRSDNPTFTSMWITGIVSLVILILFMAYVGAFHFNPVMCLFRYRFYATKNAHGVSNLLISNTVIPRPDRKLKTVKLARNVYLYTEDIDV